MKAGNWMGRHRSLARAFWIGALLLCWELSVKLLHVSPLLFPPIEEVLRVMGESFLRGDLFYQTFFSLGVILWGLLIGVVLAFLLALLSVRSQVMESLTDALTAIAHPLPGIAFLPLIIMWFGTGTGAIVAIIVHSALWPVLLNLTAGFRAVPKIYLDVGHNLSLRPLAITWEIRVRASFSYLLSGLKIGWARAWRALISAEMVFGAIGSKGGLGWYIFKQRTFMNTAGLFAGIILVIAIGMAVEELVFNRLERCTIRKWGMSAQ